MKNIYLPILWLVSGLFTQAQSISQSELKNMLLRQDIVKLYNNSFKASEILGGDKRFGPAQADMITTLFSPPTCTGSLNELIGKVYSIRKFQNTSDLLNMILDEPLPILDSINFEFYSSFSFIHKLDNDFAHDPKYKPFKKAFKEASNNIERRKILFDDENKTYRIALENSRYTTFRPKIIINLSTRIKQEFQLGISAEIKEQLKKLVNVDERLSAGIQDTISKYVEITNGAYNEITLESIYITKAARIMKGFDKNRKLLENYPDILKLLK